MPTTKESLFHPIEDDFVKLPARVLTMWRTGMIIANMIWVVVLGSILGFLMPWLLHWEPTWAWTVALFVPLGVWRWRQLKKKWLFAGYYLDENAAWSRWGLLHRSLEYAPYHRIQVVEVYSWWWPRRFDLAQLDIALGARVRTSIGPVNTAEAERLRDVLTARAWEEGVS